MITLEGDKVIRETVKVSERDVINATIRIVREKYNFPEDGYISGYSLKQEHYDGRMDDIVVRDATDSDRKAYELIKALKEL